MDVIISSIFICLTIYASAGRIARAIRETDKIALTQYNGFKKEILNVPDEDSEEDKNAN